MNGTVVPIQLKHGVTDAYLTGPKTAPNVLFYQDGLGIRPALYAMADRLASHGYRVMLPNMLWRAGAFEPFDPKTVFSGGADRERLMKIVMQVTDDAATEDTAAFLEHLDGKIATVGYCMGGGLAVLAACRFPDRVAGAASFHGGRFLTDPAAPAIIAKHVRARVYLGIAESDDTKLPEVTKNLEAALTEANVPHQVELYPGSVHGFCVPDLPPYNEEAAERHWDRLLAFLRATFAA